MKCRSCDIWPRTSTVALFSSERILAAYYWSHAELKQIYTHAHVKRQRAQCLIGVNSLRIKTNIKHAHRPPALINSVQLLLRICSKAPNTANASAPTQSTDANRPMQHQHIPERHSSRSDLIHLFVLTLCPLVLFLSGELSLVPQVMSIKGYSKAFGGAHRQCLNGLRFTSKVTETKTYRISQIRQEEKKLWFSPKSYTFIKHAASHNFA